MEDEREVPLFAIAPDNVNVLCAIAPEIVFVLCAIAPDIVTLRVVLTVFMSFLMSLRAPEMVVSKVT